MFGYSYYGCKCASYLFGTESKIYYRIFYVLTLVVGAVLPLELAVAIGGDPALILSAIMPLPEGIGEMQFCGMLRKSRTKLIKCKTIDLKAPPESEFILEGYLNPNERKL